MLGTLFEHSVIPIKPRHQDDSEGRRSFGPRVERDSFGQPFERPSEIFSQRQAATAQQLLKAGAV